LFHRWNVQGVKEKAASAKNSKAKKSDDVETYVYRNFQNELCLPGEYIRQSLLTAAKFKQDPRSPRKSALDLCKASIISSTQLASLGKTDWDYLDERRVVIQRAGINRTRPAMKAGWQADFTFEILSPEYIDVNFFRSLIDIAGRLVGVADFRPTYGRFMVTNFSVLKH
jgi:hypothetical protein